MPEFELSHYSAAFPMANGEMLICNSFMGSLLKIDKQYSSVVSNHLKNGINEADRQTPVIDKLCREGYFVPMSLDEKSLIRDIIAKERDEAGFSLILMPHENCNFRCTYCYESFARGKMDRGVVEGLKKYVSRNLDQWRHFGVAWFGGEPLMARDVLEDLSDHFIQACQHANVSYRSGITTNAYFLTPAVAKSLLDRKVKLFQVTVDGPEATHDARRHLVNGKPTYRRIIENLRHLTSLEESFTVRLRVNYDAESIDAIEGWLPEMAAMFASDTRFQLDFQAIGRWGGPNDAELKICEGEAPSLARLKLYEASRNNGFSMNTVKDFLSSHGSACYAGRKSSIVVGADGSLYKCTVAFDDPRNQIGKINADGSMSIDVGKWDMWVGTDDKNIKKCGSCWFNASCQSRACPLVAMDDANKEPPCPSTPAEISRLVELSVYGRRLDATGHANLNT